MEVSGRARTWQHPGVCWAVCLGEGGGITRVGGHYMVIIRAVSSACVEKDNYEM